MFVLRQLSKVLLDQFLLELLPLTGHYLISHIREYLFGPLISQTFSRSVIQKVLVHYDLGGSQSLLLSEEQIQIHWTFLHFGNALLPLIEYLLVFNVQNVLHLRFRSFPLIPHPCLSPLFVCVDIASFLVFMSLVFIIIVPHHALLVLLLHELCVSEYLQYLLSVLCHPILLHHLRLRQLLQGLKEPFRQISPLGQ